MTLLKADELAVACADSMYEKDIAVQEAGITLEEVKSGYARMKMIVRPDMLNGHDVCHGGFLFMLADSAFAYACNSHNKNTLAQNCDIDFLQSGKEGDELFASAEERVRGRRTGLYDVTVSRADGEVLAYFRGRSYQVKGALLHE
jgi:phenylacetic acid degradation protein PaaD